MPIDVLEAAVQVVAEGAGRGGTSAGRGGVGGIDRGPPGTLGAVARPLAAERDPTWCRARLILAGSAAASDWDIWASQPAGGDRHRPSTIWKDSFAAEIDRIRQTESTLHRLHMLAHGRTGVRAPKAVAGQGGLPATSAKDKSWSAMSGGPGKPSPSGVTWRPRSAEAPSTGRRAPDGPNGQ